MLLAIDVGNTQTVMGLFDRTDATPTSERAAGTMPGLVHHWRVTTVRDRTSDEWALFLAELLALSGFALPPFSGLDGVPAGRTVSAIALSSSVPTATGALRAMFASALSMPTVIVEPGIRTGMPILYENPREVGADRIVNAVGALDLYSPPLIVVDLGTATTFDAISAEGEYLGGAIVPGVEISMDALFARAAALSRIELGAPKRTIGRTTVESMQSGAVFGYAALVDGLCRKMADELGDPTVVATGGLGALISPHTSVVAHYEPWLTLHGLRLLYFRNQSERTKGGSTP